MVLGFGWLLKRGFLKRRSLSRLTTHDSNQADYSTSLSNTNAQNLRYLRGRKDASPLGSSLFLQYLPIELRIYIYSLVFGEGEVRLVRRLREQFWIAHGITPRLRHTPYPPPIFEEILDRWREKPTNWSLILTCRQISREASEILYNLTTIHVNDPNVLSTNLLSRHYCLAIRRLHIDWACLFHVWRPSGFDLYPQREWDRFWTVLATEMSLIELFVLIKYPGSIDDLNIDADWIRPMLKLRGIKQFDVEVRLEHYLRHLRTGQPPTQRLAKDFEEKLRVFMRAGSEEEE
ncbi:MAG: hypothetical protein LQ351_001944 [Letrouitia transgressa]|nr:MAG: hypothetical protein LQ351_001944 [Letrouitia transgressa]